MWRWQCNLVINWCCESRSGKFDGSFVIDCLFCADFLRSLSPPRDRRLSQNLWLIQHPLNLVWLSGSLIPGLLCVWRSFVLSRVVEVGWRRGISKATFSSSNWVMLKMPNRAQKSSVCTYIELSGCNVNHSWHSCCFLLEFNRSPHSSFLIHLHPLKIVYKHKNGRNSGPVCMQFAVSTFKVLKYLSTWLTET